MKKLVRLTALIMALVLCATLFAACGNKNGNRSGKGNSSKDIKISYWNSGYGSKWLEDTIKRFEAAYPEYKVKLNASAGSSAYQAFGDAEIDDTDLYLILGSAKMFESIIPLDDVLDMTAKGDSVTIREKFNKGFLENRAVDGKNYNLPYVTGGSHAVVYNKAIFKKYNLKIPRTTNEMLAVADTLLSKGEKAFVSFSDGYWNHATYVWYHQYEGGDYYYNNFFGCKDPETGESPSKQIFLNKDGRYEIVKALEKILNPDYSVDGSNSQSHTIMQTNFVQGKGAMMYNGGWFENEAKNAGELDNFGVFRLPLISTITKKLTTVKSENELRALIDAIDSVLDGEKKESDYKSGDDYTVNGKTVSAADWKHITDARQTSFNNSTTDASWTIPEYSNAIDGAKLFISYFYSDENVKKLVKDYQYYIPGMKMDEVGADFSGWSDLAKEFYQVNQSYVYYAAESDVKFHEIFTDGGATIFSNVNFIRSYLAKNEADRMTSDEVWKKITDTVEAKYKLAWLANIT